MCCRVSTTVVVDQGKMDIMKWLSDRLYKWSSSQYLAASTALSNFLRLPSPSC